jgi:peptidoglycan/xylan/chitin deacetylase (PgdA/CDA1 family)
VSARRLRGGARDALTLVDRALSHVGERFERPSLISFLFHSVFADEREIRSDEVHPQEAVTAEDLRMLVEDFLARGYSFVAGTHIERGLDASASCVWLTFDDGYANNLRLAELVREYEVPATLFVSTGYVESGRRFWWDTVYAERRRQGVSADRIDHELGLLTDCSLDDIDSYVAREFGADADRARSDLDRPLTRRELAELARVDGIEIGNHTVDHAVLPQLQVEQIEVQLRGAQEYLHEVVGAAPRSVSYPEGRCDARVIEAARAVGFAVGITTVPRKDRVPLDPERMLELGRFQLRSGESHRTQTRVIRSAVQAGNAVRRLRGRMRRA